MENKMRRFLNVLILVLMLCALIFTGAMATEEEDDFFLHDITPKPTEVPAPGTTPAPTATPEPTRAPDYLADGSQYFIVTAVGDVTLGKSLGRDRFDLFGKELKLHDDDPSFVFSNVKQIFENDQLTIANFECVLQPESDARVPSNKRENSYLFLGEPRYVSALTENSVEAVALENNHIMDFGEQGRDSTIAILKDAGVVYSNHTTMGTYEVNGIRVAMFSHQTLNQPFTSEELAVIVKNEIAAVRDQYDLIIVSYHWGNEKDYCPVTKQVNLARATIDAGADLVLGHHSHRINPIEVYNGKYIVYSLGNASFAGHNKPADMSTFIFQARYRMKDGEVMSSQFRIIPGRISSRKDYNNFILTPYDDKLSIENVISVLKSNGKNLKYAADVYKLEWE